MVYGLPMLLCLVTLSGCAQEASEAQTQEPVVTINDLRLTETDLKEELAVSPAHGREGLSPTGEEPEWLARVIERELLVQEAQRLELDRQPDFLQTIERFWKEALIKLLVARKAREVAAQVHVYEPEIEAYYQRLSQEVRTRIVSFSSETAAQRAARAIEFEATLRELAVEVVEDSGWHWYHGGELDPELEDLVFTTEAGTIRAPAGRQGRWTVVSVAERRARSVGSLSALRDEIRRTIRRQKETDAMEQWVVQLKAKARIEIDREKLAQVVR